MNIHKTKIEWCSHTWNPVTGCRHGCEYCYARRMVLRFQPHACERPITDETCATNILEEVATPADCYIVCKPIKLADETGEYTRSTPYPKGFAPTLHEYTLDYPEKRLTPSCIFVSSMGDLFGSWVPDIWIESVFNACQKAPQHTYIFLTKSPGRYAELKATGKLPTEPNFWYGSTITNSKQMERTADAFGSLPRKVKTFFSIEPILEDIAASNGWAYANNGRYAKWLIIGAMAGPGSKKHQPKREWVETIVATADAASIPVFMKNSLTDIWGAPLLHEYPKEMILDEGENDQ